MHFTLKRNNTPNRLGTFEPFPQDVPTWPNKLVNRNISRKKNARLAIGPSTYTIPKIQRKKSQILTPSLRPQAGISEPSQDEVDNSPSKISVCQPSPPKRRKITIRMSTSPRHRRMEPYLPPPPLLHEDWVDLGAPDLTLPEWSLEIARVVHAEPLVRRLEPPKRKFYHRFANQVLTKLKPKSKLQLPQEKVDPRITRADSDWLLEHMKPTSHDPHPYLSPRLLAVIEGWRIQVFLVGLLSETQDVTI
ncbi:hypothetical protein O181_050380 [Austropuccinia psidii MF-1]|uniref:Uncharacterized protein n=1 Tax=Austropuccinia psidii MF-1 TaxID=1389203 RepID=A0A9Q3E0Y6_9BASI|nr:hypothetical protein [Austropuccinia psidii MF-1]